MRSIREHLRGRKKRAGDRARANLKLYSLEEPTQRPEMLWSLQ